MAPAIDDYEKSFAPEPKPPKRIKVTAGGIHVGWAEKLASGEVAIVFLEGDEATAASEEIKKKLTEGTTGGWSIADTSS